MKGTQEKRILITGVAGFIGFHLAKALLGQSYQVIGIDNLCEYYDIQLKRDRLKILLEEENFNFYGFDLLDEGNLFLVFAEYLPEVVIHLAAQAGIWYSESDPHGCLQENVIGFTNVLECCRLLPVDHLIYASSGTVYGSNGRLPYSTDDPATHPATVYGVSKKTNELLAHAYSHAYGIPTTGLRLFAVYGPWGRPDMTYFAFTRDVFEGTAISLTDHAGIMRDFTYVDDAVEAIQKLIPFVPKRNIKWDEAQGKNSESCAPYKIYNIGNRRPVSAESFLACIERAAGKTALREYGPVKDWKMSRVCADPSGLEAAIGYQPKIGMEEGMKRFVAWYRSYYKP